MKQPSPNQRKALELISAGLFLPDLAREDDGWHARWRPVGDFDESVATWLDEYVRAAAMTPLTANAEDSRHETLHDAWMQALRSRTGLVRWDDDACAAFADELSDWHGGGADDTAARRGITFRFDADASTLSCRVPRGRPAMKALGQSARVFGPLRGLRSAQGGLLAVVLARNEAESFLSRGARDLAAAGYSVTGCDLAAAITAAAEIVPGDSARPSAPSDLKLVIKVAGQPVSAEEIRFLLEQKSSLVFFREHWIEVDRNVLKEALRALEKSGACRLTRTQALAFACGIGRIGRLELEEAATHGWLRGLLNGLRQARVDDRPKSGGQRVPDGFRGKLRDYQRRGVAWLGFLTDNGFGALLADDMGLGKTVQTIAWALREKAERPAPILIVAPLTLLANWKHEFAAFAPGMRIYVHQGRDRHVASGFRRAAGEADVVLTSYNLLVKDHLAFAEVAWHALVLDEAQAIKNPDTAVARAVRALTPPKRIALTGTPIENSVADIWSIEEFLNPGFLGDRKSFADRFTKPLALDPHATAGTRLRHALEPFVLRRLKSDEGIAAELGPKREIREFCELSPRARADYETALADYRATERRRGDVFALLTRLKLICDSTEQTEAAAVRTGKFERLTELLERIYANGESALVFTQYAKVGRELKAKLEERFGLRVPFLHGALTAKQREHELQTFDGMRRPTCFILSLKAGGFGLNLTKASHVIHYDRWWNPAVENQATDRAHRIGQTRTVFVHLLMTAGTVEEHVDEILAHKTTVSGGLVTSGEAFLSQLPPELFEKAVSLDE